MVCLRHAVCGLDPGSSDVEVMLQGSGRSVAVGAHYWLEG